MPERTRDRCRSERRPVCLVSVDLSRVTIWDTLATESFGNPVSSAFNKRFPGASAHLRLLVKGDTDNGCDPTMVKGVALDHQHRAPESRLRTDRFSQVGPPDFTLMGYHSLRSRVCRAAVSAN